MYISDRVRQGINSNEIPQAMSDWSEENAVPIRVVTHVTGTSGGWSRAQVADATDWPNVSDTIGTVAQRRELCESIGITYVHYGASQMDLGLTSHAYLDESGDYSAGGLCSDEQPINPIVFPAPSGSLQDGEPGPYGENIVGEMEARVIYDWFGCFRYVLEAGGILKRFKTVMLDALDSVGDPEFAERQTTIANDRQLEALRSFTSSHIAARLEALRSQIASHEQTMVAYQNHLNDAMQVLASDQQAMESLQLIVAGDDSRDTLTRDFAALQSHPRVTRLTFSNNKITIVTSEDFRITRPDTGDSRWLGQFRITVNLNTAEILIYNLSTPRNGRQHPHVTESYPCFGGHERDFRLLVQKCELGMLFELLCQYLETLNITDDWGAYGAYWFDLPDERPLEVAEEVTA